MVTRLPAGQELLHMFLPEKKRERANQLLIRGNSGLDSFGGVVGKRAARDG